MSGRCSQAGGGTLQPLIHSMVRMFLAVASQWILGTRTLGTFPYSFCSMHSFRIRVTATLCEAGQSAH